MSDDNSTIINHRFEIRQLGLEHLDWVRAIQSHSNIFHSPVWTKIYPENQTERVYRAFNAARTGSLHGLESGLSYGVFDKEYKFRRRESAETNGALYWDHEDLTATPEDLLAQMDFPLVSVALASDSANALEAWQSAPMMEVIPAFALILKRRNELDTRDESTWKATGPNQVMMRHGTSTRSDYAGHGLMKKLAHSLIRKAAELGFRAISIDCLSDAVFHVWMNPPPPFKATLVSQTNINQMEEKDPEGKVVLPYSFVDQMACRIFIDLI